MTVDDVLRGDCLTILPTLPENSVDLAFADPPFNIGYEYDVYEDRKSREVYLEWTQRWLMEVRRGVQHHRHLLLCVAGEEDRGMEVLVGGTGPSPRDTRRR